MKYSILFSAMILFVLAGCNTKTTQPEDGSPQMTEAANPAGENGATAPQATDDHAGHDHAATEASSTPEASAIQAKTTEKAANNDDKGITYDDPEPLTMSQLELQNRLRGYSGDHPSVMPIPVADIKALMPQKLQGLFVYENDGETSAALGAPATFVVTIYRENYDILKIAITDTGGATSSVLAAAQWANQSLNQKTKTGYDRTTTYKTYPAHEQYDEESKIGQFEYIIDSRYVVSIQGKNHSMEGMRKAADELNLDRLKQLGAKKK